MRQLPPSRSSTGYTPNRLQPLAVAPVLDQGQRLTDIQAIQRLFANGENGGYWPADPAYLYEDSAGTIPATLNGVVGLRTNNVTGLPNAIQATTANKPYLRRTPVSGKYWLDSNTFISALTATFASSLGSACTIATVGAEGVTIAENQTISTSYNIAPVYSYNGDILIINRALTVAEKALVARVFGRGVPRLGSERASNGSFDVDSGWTKIGNMTIVDGVARGGVEDIIYPTVEQLNRLVIGSVYIYKFTVSNYAYGYAYFGYQTPESVKSSNGSFTRVSISTATRLAVSLGNPGVMDIDDVSVKEIL